MFFEWDEKKNKQNIEKHNVSFNEAKDVFSDECRLTLRDDHHSQREERFFCIGKIEKGIVTVRFTKRGDRIRLIGAGLWRIGRKIYEKENSLHKSTQRY